MNATGVFVGLAGAAVVWGVVAGMLILHALRERGEEVSFILVRLMLPAYVHRYATLTREETGKPGILFYHYVVAFNLGFLAALAALASTVL
jgi:hypothetical protein